MAAAIAAAKRPIYALAVFSGVINILMLAGPLFMLQVYDRVMTSGSMPTLFALLGLTLILYAALGLLDGIRSRVVVRMGRECDAALADRIFNASIARSARGRPTATAALRERDHLRQFLSGPGPTAALDAPWTPIYLLVVFALHWVLGIAATLGACILMVFAWLNERAGRTPLLNAGKAAAGAISLADVAERNAEAMTAMGMTDAIRNRWRAASEAAGAHQLTASDRLGALTAATKTMRLALQSIILAVGAALALNGEISAGAIVAATVLFGRAMAPVEQALSHWRGFVKARESLAKLRELLAAEPDVAPTTQLPRPLGHVAVEDLAVAAPGTRTPLLNRVSFAVPAGHMVAVVGPSGSGKSTLARALVGVWPPAQGVIRLDGAALNQWRPQDLGPLVGYLPQDVELFQGTVRDNIARFRSDVSDEAVVAAAKTAHAHDMIVGLPKGYETEIGAFGTHLSAGQRQRVALARAVFDNPVLIVLDEPNANLDKAGETALSAALATLRAQGATVFVVSHRLAAINDADLMLVLDAGQVRAFGPRDAVIARLQGAAAAGANPAAANAPAPNQTRATTNETMRKAG